MPTLVDAFSGIGGFSYGLQHAGFQTIRFCERSEFCRKVICKRWPTVPISKDIRTLTYPQIGEWFDLLTAGFPCQDISNCRQGKGLSGFRSGLYWEAYRLTVEAYPNWILLENVPALRTKGADLVLESLEKANYTATPFVVGANAAGGLHQRNRVWVLAYANSFRLARGKFGQCGKASESKVDVSTFLSRTLAKSESDLPSSEFMRSPHGVSNGVDRITAVGNSIVPQIAYIFGRMILATEQLIRGKYA